MIEEAGATWPEYVREWHKKNMSISTESRPSISEVMCNVNKPWKFGDRCVCATVHERLQAKGFTQQLPKVCGHVFLIGREYTGPHKRGLMPRQCQSRPRGT